MPEMTDVILIVSIDGRTLRVEGRPIDANGDAMSNDQLKELTDKNGIDYLYHNPTTDKFYVVYPIAVGADRDAKGCFKEKWRTFTSATARRPAGEHTWHSLPYLGFCDTATSSGIVAFHSPFTNYKWRAGSAINPAKSGQTIHLFRGEVSGGCKRMVLEHLMELLHILGGNKKDFLQSRMEKESGPLVKAMNSRGSKADGPVKGIDVKKEKSKFIYMKMDYDIVDNDAGLDKIVNVKYPLYGKIRSKTKHDESYVHQTWSMSDPGRETWVQYFLGKDYDTVKTLKPSDPFGLGEDYTGANSYEEIEVQLPGDDDTN
jgi:hypothetical protein